jgi:hypothetical protein
MWSKLGKLVYNFVWLEYSFVYKVLDIMYFRILSTYLLPRLPTLTMEGACSQAKLALNWIIHIYQDVVAPAAFHIYQTTPWLKSFLLDLSAFYYQYLDEHVEDFLNSLNWSLYHLIKLLENSDNYSLDYLLLWYDYLNDQFIGPMIEMIPILQDQPILADILRDYTLFGLVGLVAILFLFYWRKVIMGIVLFGVSIILLPLLFLMFVLTKGVSLIRSIFSVKTLKRIRAWAIKKRQNVGKQKKGSNSQQQQRSHGSGSGAASSSSEQSDALPPTSTATSSNLDPREIMQRFKSRQSTSTTVGGGVDGFDYL